MSGGVSSVIRLEKYSYSIYIGLFRSTIVATVKMQDTQSVFWR